MPKGAQDHIFENFGTTFLKIWGPKGRSLAPQGPFESEILNVFSKIFKINQRAPKRRPRGPPGASPGSPWAAQGPLEAFEMGLRRAETGWDGLRWAKLGWGWLGQNV